ncbi:peptide-methionine (S)-S-oxide reductase [Andreprevotia lacus DSM 23236]|jgi:peptide-methionine (S)-S-oxide reductase|uniref:Peptide methionine sulfoxide reductase MsrA n=1 Tax=Andreprevotia lacus DSM 23236 TaxID=1121001 RepID=A0A1W1XNQ1_9NEIS|nr:peptide-methionine (S)-S-oxide reductase MsrA [Andreprevotia lacus]SMC25497.1 peptide-methionine (S)-S-oxide reductase [Andreprevotia lacus DSM 23236]
MAQATLAGGCFWCLEAVFQRVRGVDQVVSGYMGGHTAHPDYRAVCGGDTGHAEVVQISYDDSVVSFDSLLDVFFTIHDPTTLNRQGNDVGTQYRSAIFCHDAAQQQQANAKVAELTTAHAFNAPIVTQIVPLQTFYPAETYHQDYFNRNPNQPYCMAVVGPKVGKLLKYHGELSQ